MVNLAKKVPIQDPTIIRFALLKGFKPYMRVAEAAFTLCYEIIFILGNLH